MLTYNIEIDRTMIGNIIVTDTGEAGGLVHPAILLWVVPLGIFPAFLVLLMPLRLPRYRWRPFIPLGAMAGLVAVALAASVTWPWFDANGSRLGGKVLPWAYIATRRAILKSGCGKTGKLCRWRMLPLRVICPQENGRSSYW